MGEISPLKFSLPGMPMGVTKTVRSFCENIEIIKQHETLNFAEEK